MTDPIFRDYTGPIAGGQDLQQLIDWVQGLPPMPEVASRALRLIDDPNCTAEQIAAVLSHDVSLAAQILRAGNCAALSRNSKAATLQEAVQVAGFRYVKGIVMASVTRRWNPNFTPIARAVWERSIGTAVASRVALSRIGRGDADRLYLAGLLHNLGQVVMLSHPGMGRGYPRVLQTIAVKSVTFTQAEQEILGFTHPVIGALVAQKWGFPVELCRAILHHDDPVAGAPDMAEHAALKFASLISLTAGIGSVPGYPLHPEDIHNLSRQMGFPQGCLDDELKRIVDLTHAAFTAEVALFA